MANEDSLNCAGYTILREWTAIDECSNITIDSQYLFVSDQIAPTFTLPADTMVTCIHLDSINVGEPFNILDNWEKVNLVEIIDQLP